MAANSNAASFTVGVIGPAVSWLWAMGMMYLPESRPRVGFKPTTPFIAAGHTMEPSVSVPIATGARPAAAATPLPALEPQGERSRTCGFLARPPTALQPLMEW